MKQKVLWQLIVPLLSLCVLFLLLTPGPTDPKESQEVVELSVIFREQDPVWATTRDGMEQAAADLGAELRFLVPEIPNDAEEQREVLERELESGADGIILIPADRDVLAEPVRDTNRVVVTLETEMEDADGFVGVDNRALGQALARSAMNGVYQGSTILLLDSVPGNNGVRERLEAARELLEQEGRQVVQVVPTEEEQVAERLRALILRTDPSAMMAFEASMLEDASGVVRSMKTEIHQSWKFPPLLYGMGSTPAIAAGLEQSHITAIQAQDDFSAGYIAVMTAVRTARHQLRQEPEPLPFLLVRRENMYDMDRQKLLFPVTR